jgi:hypothetical protein
MTVPRGPKGGRQDKSSSSLFRGLGVSLTRLGAWPDPWDIMSSSAPAHCPSFGLNSFSQRRMVLASATEGASETLPPANKWPTTLSISAAT